MKAYIELKGVSVLNGYTELEFKGFSKLQGYIFRGLLAASIRRTKGFLLVAFVCGSILLSGALGGGAGGGFSGNRSAGGSILLSGALSGGPGEGFSGNSSPWELGTWIIQTPSDEILSSWYNNQEGREAQVPSYYRIFGIYPVIFDLFPTRFEGIFDSWLKCCRTSPGRRGCTEGCTELEFEGCRASPTRRGRRERARYGLRARRVGEAAHPGPPLTRASRARRHDQDADEAEHALRSEAGRANGADWASRREFRCSALTVPLAWAAARGEAQPAVLERLCSVAPGAADAARDGYAALCRALRDGAVQDEAGLAELLSARAGAAPVPPDTYFDHGAQRWFLDWAARRDGNTGLLEGSYDAAVQELAAARRASWPPRPRAPLPPPPPPSPPPLPQPSSAPVALGPTGESSRRDPLSEGAAPPPPPPAPQEPGEDADEAMSECSDSPTLLESSSDEGESVYGGPDTGNEGDDQQQQQQQQQPASPQSQAFPCASAADLRSAFAALDAVNLSEVFERRAFVLKSVPVFLRGPLRAAFRVALEEARRCRRARDNPGRARAWKLFSLVPRLLLHRPPGERFVPKEELGRRCERFAAGRWTELLGESCAVREPRIRSSRPSEEQRALRAEMFVELGELSSGRQSLESAELAPGNQATLDALQGPRPTRPRDPLPAAVRDFVPDRRFRLDSERFVRNLRGARRGAAAGPSGLTSDHLKVLLEDDVALDLLHELAQDLATADVHEEIVSALRLGRLTALRKPGGGVRGIVAGDVLRRLVARTMAQQINDEVEAATAPHQYALSTRAGTECVAHALQAITAEDGNMTILSIDGIGAFDSISRAAMLQSLSELPEASSILPFVMLFYGQASGYLWENAAGEVHTVRRAEGGEQGDALMPMLYALGQHRALEAINARLHPGERMFAFLDDLYVVSTPERVVEIYRIVEEELWAHARIRVHTGKTQVWNRNGVAPEQIEELGCGAWRGAGDAPPERQGVKILGTPLGHPAFVRAMLAEKLEEQRTLLRRIPSMGDTQSAWLLLLFCAAARATYVLRVVSPDLAAEYARAHDEALWECLCTIAAVDPETAGVWRQVAQLPFHQGGLGLRSAERIGVAAHWASWADSLEMIQARHPPVAQAIVRALEMGGGDSDVLRAAHQCAEAVAAAGVVVPTWPALAAGARPEFQEHSEQEPGEAQHGWQFFAARALDARFRRRVWRQLSRPERAVLRSQSGPCAGAALSAIPTSSLTRIGPDSFRVLLRRRLRLGVSPAGRRCRCSLFLDPLGNHRAACPHAGVLARRGFPLESAAARVAREAGARVRTNVFVRDMDVGVLRPDDGRRVEVLAAGLPLFNGAQLAVDTTLVCALRCDGTPRAGADTRDGAALVAARRRKERTYPELTGERGRARLVVLALEVGGRWSAEAAQWVRLLAQARARTEPRVLRSAARRAWQRRWTGVLAVAAQRALAESLLDSTVGGGADGDVPSTQCVLEEARYTW